MSAGSWARRAGLALLVHAALLLSWPLLRPLYAPAFRGVGQQALTVLSPGPAWLRVRLVAGADPAVAMDQIAPDTTVRLEHREMKGTGAFGASSLFHGWLPTSVLLALFLAATPLPWRARRAPLLWALAWLHLFLLARLVVSIAHACAQLTVEGQPLWPLSTGAERALRLAWHFAWSEMFANYLAPLAIWSLCVFDRRSSRP